MNHPSLRKKNWLSTLIGDIKREYWLYIMLLPGLAYYLLFRYGPMAGLTMAFQNFMPFLGFAKSPWVGFAHFERFFNEPAFGMLFRNTLILGLMNILFFFPIPIILSLLLNELRSVRFKRLTQTFIYMPHFLSWVVVYAITFTLLTQDGGVVNGILEMLGFNKVNFLTNERLFRPLIMGQVIWKESGWGTIIFLAALTAIDPELYNAAKIDGAGRWRCLLHITLPGIRSTVVTMLILRLGTFLDTGFEQLLLMINPLTRQVGEVFDTYVYTNGILGGQFSYTAAVGMFKSLVALTLIIIANTTAKRLGEEGLY